MRVDGIRGAALIAAPALLAAIVYASCFGGFWLSDDFGFVHRTWLASSRGDLWRDTWAQFSDVDRSGVVYYRPMMIASAALNQWLASDNFAGWFVLNYLAHLANVALVALLVIRLAASCGRDGRIAGAAAATFFAVSPVLTEGVFWIAARADAWVTLLTFAGLYAWALPPAANRAAGAQLTAPTRAPAMLPLVAPVLLLLALGFKESAAVFPLQLALVALTWPRRLSAAQIGVVIACALLVVLFLALRAHFFGAFWRVYTRTDAAPRLDQLALAITSVAAWWRGLTQGTPVAAFAYLGLSVGACAVAVTVARGGGAGRLTAALFFACAGQILATLLSIGPLAASGEGGRLTYTPIAWLTVALGVAYSVRVTRSQANNPPSATRQPGAQIGLAMLLCASLVGIWMLRSELRTIRSAQELVRGVVTGMPAWADAHPGFTLLLIDESYGPVVTVRNAQAWLALPPIQSAPLLDRVLPTLPTELDARHGQLAAGLATRLAQIRPERLDADELARALVRDDARWPDHYACWSVRMNALVEIPAPDPANRADWSDALRRALKQCSAPPSYPPNA